MGKQYHPCIEFADPNEPQINDFVDPDELVDPRAQCFTLAREGGCNDEILKDMHQTGKDKQQPGTPNTPSIIVPGPYKKGVEDCEDSNVLIDEFFSESPLEKKLRKRSRKVKKLEQEVIELSVLNRCIERENQ